MSSIIHKAKLEVDEEGTVAAAATSCSMLEESEEDEIVPLYFIANQPFLFLLEHSFSDTILFCAKINEPVE